MLYMSCLQAQSANLANSEIYTFSLTFNYSANSLPNVACKDSFEISLSWGHITILTSIWEPKYNVGLWFPTQQTNQPLFPALKIIQNSFKFHYFFSVFPFLMKIIDYLWVWNKNEFCAARNKICLRCW